LPNPSQPDHPMLSERALRTSIPHIPFVVLDFITAQKRPEFVLVRNLPMVLTLIPNVLAKLVHPRPACGECALASLPVKLRQPNVLRAQPIVGTGLELPNGVAQRGRAPEEKKRLDVLGLRVDFDRVAAQTRKRPAHVGLEVGPEVIG